MYTYPFGSTLTPVVQTGRSPKQIFIPGVSPVRSTPARLGVSAPHPASGRLCTTDGLNNNNRWTHPHCRPIRLVSPRRHQSVDSLLRAGMAGWPDLFAIPALRALVRVSVVFVPALLYHWRGPREQSFGDFIQLRGHWRRGVLVGGGVAVAYFLIGWASGFGSNQTALQIPSGFALWFNFILGSPVAEEAFFRGVLLKELSPVLGTAHAILISTLAFALLHLPQWAILSQQSGLALLSSFATIFLVRRRLCPARHRHTLAVGLPPVPAISASGTNPRVGVQ